MNNHKLVSQEDWLDARKAHLVKEEALTRLRDDLSRELRELPWVRVEKEYLLDAPQGAGTLADLFGPQSQLLIYHFMLGPDWKEGCPSCSMLADHFDGMRIHLTNRDVRLVAVSRAPLEQIRSFQKRMGWQFPWAS